MTGTRRAVADTVRWLMARGLYAGTSGNVSAYSPRAINQRTVSATARRVAC